MNTIAIDCGASFIKGCRILDGELSDQRQVYAPKVHGDADLLEPSQIDALIPLVRQMILDLAGGQASIRLCISNEMHGFLLAYEDGRPYTDYISWQKELGSRPVHETTAQALFTHEADPEDLLYTGMATRAGLPSCNLRYLAESGVLEKAGGPLTFYTLGDYILKALSNQTPMIHPTNAAATGLYDLRTGDWNHRLIAAAGGDTLRFPSVGEQELVFQMGTLTVHALPAIGDQQAALLGAGVTDTETLSFNLGTGAQVSRLSKEPACGAGFQIRPYFRGYYIKTIPHIPSGRALNVYIRFIRDVLETYGVKLEDAQIWEGLLRAESEAEDTGLICDMSFFENAITGKTAGSIENIGEYALNLGSLMHAVLRQMADNFIHAADIVEPELCRVNKIIFSGGVAKRIDTLRTYILQHYQSIECVYVATNETLYGLYRYGAIQDSHFTSQGGIIS